MLYILPEHFSLMQLPTPNMCRYSIIMSISQIAQTHFYSSKSKLNSSQVMKIWRAEQISSVRDDFLKFIQCRALNSSS
jgi:hypothetical protein